MNRAVIVTLLVVGGCVADADDVEVTQAGIYTANLLEAREVAYTAYALSYDAEPSEACQYRVRHIDRTYLPQAELRLACGTTLAINGCAWTASNSVYIEDVMSNHVRTHAHEFLHILLGCMRNNSDSGHGGPAWTWITWLTL
jgi:hypothetical protein